MVGIWNDQQSTFTKFTVSLEIPVDTGPVKLHELVITGNHNEFWNIG
jgi:hypothetical protein